MTASAASQFAGWLHTATGAHEDAGVLYDQALRLGLQAGDEDLAATALSMRGHLAWVTGDIATMAALSQAAAQRSTMVGTRAIATQQSGRALAMLGERQEALHAIGQAEDMLTGASDHDGPDSLYFYGPELLTAQRGLILAYLAGTPAEHAAAADIIAAGVQALPPDVRDSQWVAWYRARVAGERAASGDVQESVAGLRMVLGITSAKTRNEVVRVHRSMVARWPNHPDVVELGEALR
jgi:hypothetical protein